jgi:nucleoside phosphorylase
MGTAVGTFVAAESLGSFAGLDFMLVRSSPGSVGQGSAQGIVNDAIDEFHPRMVVAVGVAFGLKVGVSSPEAAVLVASAVKNYERVRVGLAESGSTEIRDRGDVDNPDPIRLQKVRTVADVEGFNVFVGQVLSGEKLVDHPGFRRYLKSRFPDALGGEMEASGVAAACARRRIPWLLIKAVTDRGDGLKKSAHADEDYEQQRAAYAAMRVLLAAGKAGCL